MASLNKVQLIGNLGKDPKVSNLPSGNKVATFSIAMTESWKDKNTGDRKERTEWANVVIFNDSLIGVAEKYLKKGSRCYVEGAMQTRKYTDQAGVDKWSTEVVLAQFRGQLLLLDAAQRPAPNESDYGATRGARPSATAPQTHAPADLDDDSPF